MTVKLTAIIIPLAILSACRSNEQSNSVMNVDENLTATDMNATSYTNATDTSLNASGIDNDVIAPPPLKKGHGK